MYNRYIRNDNGVYTRIPQEERHQEPPSSSSPPPQGENRQSASPPPQGENRQSYSPPPPPPSSGGGRTIDGLTSFLRHLLDQFHLDRVDTGDLLLLGLLFFLFKEDADEELLVALGLLLIL